MLSETQSATWLVTVTLGAASLLAPTAAQAVMLSDLAPGSAYRYVFTTAGYHDATSPDIAVYNAFVASEAAQNKALAGFTFRAIGSTATVNVIDNLSCGQACDSAPIFTLDGKEVATSLAQLFSGSILSPLIIDQFGRSNNSPYVFTGSQRNGATSFYALGNANVTSGYSGFISGGYYIDEVNTPASYDERFYGLSGAYPITATTAVPEPASLALLGAGFVGLGLARRRRTRV